MRKQVLTLALFISLPLCIHTHAFAQSSVNSDSTNLELVTQLREESLLKGKAHVWASTLSDEIGPRLTGSPGYVRAVEWTTARFREWGLVNVRTENFGPFGRGWSVERAQLRVVQPFSLDIPAIPKAWTKGSNGKQISEALIANIQSEEDLAQWKGKIEGKILLLTQPRTPVPHDKADSHRYSHEELHALIDFQSTESSSRRDSSSYQKMAAFQKKLQQFLIDEKALAILSPSRADDGTIFVQGGGSYKTNEPMGVSSLVLAAEHYHRLYRLLEKKKSIQLEIDVAVTEYPENPDAAVNVFAELPGSDKKDEYVILGAHLDSWHGGTGATDNAAGVAVVMEALRLLKESGFKPRRTILIALWGGEEQGLLGSQAFVKKYLAERADVKKSDEQVKDGAPGRNTLGPLQLKAMHGKVSAYFNLDNGAGKIRGIYCENNNLAQAIFTNWLVPFHDLGAKVATLRKTGSTDHVAFDRVGIPGFQFIQDTLDYNSRTHHSNMDVLDKVPAADINQAALIMASFVANSANRADKIPRKPLPK